MDRSRNGWIAYSGRRHMQVRCPFAKHIHMLHSVQWLGRWNVKMEWSGWLARKEPTTERTSVGCPVLFSLLGIKVHSHPTSTTRYHGFLSAASNPTASEIKVEQRPPPTAQKLDILGCLFASHPLESKMFVTVADSKAAPPHYWLIFFSKSRFFPVKGIDNVVCICDTGKWRRS